MLELGGNVDTETETCIAAAMPSAVYGFVDDAESGAEAGPGIPMCNRRAEPAEATGLKSEAHGLDYTALSRTERRVTSPAVIESLHEIAAFLKRIPAPRDARRLRLPLQIQVMLQMSS